MADKIYCLKIVPMDCPLGNDDCEGCRNFGSYEHGIITCYAKEENED